MGKTLRRCLACGAVMLGIGLVHTHASASPPPALASQIQGTWICDAVGKNSVGKVKIEYRRGGSYVQKTISRFDRDDGPLTLYWWSAGAWSLEGSTISDRTLEVHVDHVVLDGLPLSDRVRADIQNDMRAHFDNLTEFADVLYVTPTTYGQAFHEDGSRWDCTRDGDPVTS